MGIKAVEQKATGLVPESEDLGMTLRKPLRYMGLNKVMYLSFIT